MVKWATDYQSVIQQLQNIQPISYGKTRNYIDGQVTYLSPYISRGVISTKQVLETVAATDVNLNTIEKFIQELAWRDYWQQIWIARGNQIDQDLKQEQQKVSHHKMPKNIVNATTGISAIDQAISQFYETGYLHNHVRMYIATIACNIGQAHWKVPAQWMYYHLLDADWASNALSWQWVVGANSKKKYYANQGNINKYCYTTQFQTFLDVSYDDFEEMSVPPKLSEILLPPLTTVLPSSQELILNSSLPTCIYNFYNLDCLWKKGEECNRILLLEPSHFEKYPISPKSLKFMLELSENIPTIQIYVGEFDELVKEYELETIYYKEHPLNTHYQGIQEDRDWMF